MSKDSKDLSGQMEKYFINLDFHETFWDSPSSATFWGPSQVGHVRSLATKI